MVLPEEMQRWTIGLFRNRRPQKLKGGTDPTGTIRPIAEGAVHKR